MSGLLWVCLGAAVGAPARYLTDLAVRARHDTALPWGTLVVNVVGSLVLGVLVGLGRHHDVPVAVVLGVGTGFCGALTTWSTLGHDTVRLATAGPRSYAVLNVVVTLVAGLGAALLGYAVGGAL